MLCVKCSGDVRNLLIPSGTRKTKNVQSLSPPLFFMGYTVESSYRVSDILELDVCRDASFIDVCDLAPSKNDYRSALLLEIGYIQKRMVHDP